MMAQRALGGLPVTDRTEINVPQARRPKSSWILLAFFLLTGLASIASYIEREGRRAELDDNLERLEREMEAIEKKVREHVSQRSEATPEAPK